MRSPRTGLLAPLTIATLVLGVVASSALAADNPGQITTFPLPSGITPGAIISGPGGNLWFTEPGLQIGYITPAGQITQVPTQSRYNPPQIAPKGIAVGPEGNLWTAGAGLIKRITPTGQTTEFPPPGQGNPGANRITAGPDGNLWFTETSVNKIGRITPSGRITEFPIPSVASPPYAPTEGSQPLGIVGGPDGNVWFTEERGNRIGRITPSGQIAEFPLQVPNSRPSGITAGPYGNLWFTEQRRIGRITPEGQITEFPLPVTPEGLGESAEDITAGPDGNLWFTASPIPIGHPGGEGEVGRITPRGQVTLFRATPPPRRITAGPDGNLWFTSTYFSEVGPSSIGRITPGMLGSGIAAEKARVRGRWAKVAVACWGAVSPAACHGRLDLSLVMGRRRHPPGTAIQIGRRHYALASGATRRVAVRLSKRAFRVLARHHRLRVEATTNVTGGRGERSELVLQLTDR